jgi:hypothetical protein
MNQLRITARLFSFMASGGSLERALGPLPAFKAQIESASEFMKSNGRYATVGIESQAARFRAVLDEKEEAIRKGNFDLAAAKRDDEFALAASLGFSQTAETRITVSDVETQMQRLSAALRE